MSPSDHFRPRVAISACLLGERVRYDGADKAHGVARELLTPHVEWRPVCPEVEAGFGVPRPAIEVVADHPVRVARVEDGSDVTAGLAAAAEHRIETLIREGVDGHVLKARSPSCGIDDVPRPDARGLGSGLYVSLLEAAMPDLPMEDEAGLDDRDRLRRFLGAVAARASTRTGSSVDATAWVDHVLCGNADLWIP